ncbi:type II and III secretion system protein family protein [Sinorhizobium alkalisoli]|uniref:Pilus assembly protein CpaC n=1 Tax=Sinorhizobium alkalisoli TaxID=1752398 RepID=A0A1E3V9N1_9HYPH|nr:type II and III secretion system protein family protein [Sinorhizobium alkalisoli]MCA1490051.1 type II and III secretion system protein family protein [Ensifer sp. NBAIM29]ODR90338.1 pilus assembly protein CpaC [Sinorhizobium alkalisoli]QFI68251.1 Type II/IV secretion system secretin RcpA/CpaC, associated with Flp pilus assembly [Sinorhizobium alkalisoli]
MKRDPNKFRASVAACLSFCLAFSGITLPTVPAAQAAASSVVRLGESGPGVKRKVNLGLNKAVVVDLPTDAHDILVADPSLADAITRTSRRIYLFGKAVGQTNIFVFGPNGEEIVSLEIAVERDVAGLEANLRRFIPDSDIKVEIVSDNVVLTGTVRTPLDSNRAIDLARAFLKGGEATTRSITAQGTNGDADIFAEDRQTSQIVNLLTIEGEDQVTLKVTVAEVSRQVLKQLGFNGRVSDGESGIGFRNPANLGDAVSLFANAAIRGSIGGTTISSYMNAMEQAGVMRTLAEPSLTAISGQEAKFYVGGEFRLAGTQEVSADDDTGSPTVEREVNDVEYGIRLNFKPVVLGAGRISLQIETNVSEPTYEGSVVTGNNWGSANPGIPGNTFLGIRRREASTSVELPSGGSIVIAGLVQDNIRQALSGVPGASKIPILGTLFRSKDFQRNETELVIIATPYLVRPVARSALSRPDDNFNPANDLDSFFLGRVNRIYGRPEAQAPAGRYHGNVGFIYK